MPCLFSFFFFNDTATTEIYTLSLHDALPILSSIGLPSGPIASSATSSVGMTDARARTPSSDRFSSRETRPPRRNEPDREVSADRKSTRLNSSHLVISYAVFCLKKKKKQQTTHPILIYNSCNHTFLTINLKTT